MAFKKYNYVLTETAENDIDEVFSYISEDLSNTIAATDLADELEEKLSEICKNPLSGRIVENDFLKRDDIRRFLVRNYIVYYVIDEENCRVAVLRMVYGRRNQDEIIKEL